MNRTPLTIVKFLYALFLPALIILSLSPAQAVKSVHAANEVFSFGYNDFGATGLGTSAGSTLIATPIDTTNLTGKVIAQVATGSSQGSNYSLLLSEDGVVFSFGRNLNGRTGLGTTSGGTLIATPIDTTNLIDKTITQIASGAAHNLLLSDDGTVFSFGHNGLGATGLGTTSGDTLIAKPINVTNLQGKTITQVTASGNHSLILTDDGTVFSFGWNLYGQTGRGTDVGSTLVAMPIDTTNLAGRRITQVAAGEIHSLLLSDDGTVFSFGRNEYGRTGLGTTSGNALIATPIDMTNLAGREITQIAAGGDHSLLLANDGAVFSFGLNNFGRTGQGTEVGNTLIATQIDTTNLLGKQITQVAAGRDHSLLLADDGSIFAFGANGNGRTGLGTTSGITLIATPIDTTNLLDKRITQVAAGGEHSLLLAVPEPSAFALIALALFAFSSLRRLVDKTGQINQTDFRIVPSS